MIDGVVGARRSRTFRRVRIAVLLSVLVFTAAWGAATSWRRHVRTRWDRPLQVGVVLLSPDGDVDVEAWRAGVARLSARLAEEMRRWRGPGPEPFSLSVVGPVRWEGRLPLTPRSDGPWDRLAYALAAWRTVRDIDRVAGAAAGGFDVRVFFQASALYGDAVGFAEGSGAENGDVAFVRGSATGDLSIPLQAIGHELLHTVGASDKYDAEGHAKVPDGLADPDLVPPWPQKYAEWMVGEIPVSPHRGRVPASLDELRVGPVTAREIGWARE